MDVIEQELSRKEYRKPVILGMVANLINNEVVGKLVIKLNKLCIDWYGAILRFLTRIVVIFRFRKEEDVKVN
ncbi:hypothetical protein [Sporosarcina sp. G11-34]|uniref:hypothetical protein n=1 Tax=Sporosarcina sp. G11-34 TaxID=2849605 RepID=UPI0022A98ECB|nr:hypothetical protein [Sporosarcina sp. G11-34]